MIKKILLLLAFLSLSISSNAAIKCSMTFKSIDTAFSFGAPQNNYDPTVSTPTEDIYAFKIRKSNADKALDCPFFIFFGSGLNPHTIALRRNANLAGNFLEWQFLRTDNRLLWPTTSSSGFYLISGTILGGTTDFSGNFKVSIPPNQMAPYSVSTYNDSADIVLYAGDITDFVEADRTTTNLNIETTQFAEWEDSGYNPITTKTIGPFSLNSLVNITDESLVVSNYPFFVDATSANSQILIHTTNATQTYPYQISFNGLVKDLSSGNAVRVLTMPACTPSNNPTKRISTCSRSSVRVTIKTLQLLPANLPGDYTDILTLDIIPQ